MAERRVSEGCMNFSSGPMFLLGRGKNERVSLVMTSL